MEKTATFFSDGHSNWRQIIQKVNSWYNSNELSIWKTEAAREEKDPPREGSNKYRDVSKLTWPSSVIYRGIIFRD